MENVFNLMFVCKFNTVWKSYIVAYQETLILGVKKDGKVNCVKSVFWNLDVSMVNVMVQHIVVFVTLDGADQIVIHQFALMVVLLFMDHVIG